MGNGSLKYLRLKSNMILTSDLQILGKRSKRSSYCYIKQEQASSSSMSNCFREKVCTSIQMSTRNTW